MTKIGPAANSQWDISEGGVDISRNNYCRPAFLTLKAKPANVKIDLHKTAIIIIDMQNDFCSDGGYLAKIGVDCSSPQALIPKINALLKQTRQQNTPIIWVNWAVRADMLNIPASIPHLHMYKMNNNSQSHIDFMKDKGGWGTLQGSWGAEIVAGLDTKEQDIYVAKHRFSGFFNTELDQILRNMGITSLFFAGLATDICVYATLQDAAFLGYDVLMLEDLVATGSPDFCVAATKHHVQQLFGFTILSTDLIAAMADIKP